MSTNQFLVFSYKPTLVNNDPDAVTLPWKVLSGIGLAVLFLVFWVCARMKWGSPGNSKMAVSANLGVGGMALMFSAQHHDPSQDVVADEGGAGPEEPSEGTMDAPARSVRVRCLKSLTVMRDFTFSAFHPSEARAHRGEIWAEPDSE